MTNLTRRPRALVAGLAAVALATVLALGSAPAGAAAPPRTLAAAALQAGTASWEVVSTQRCAGRPI